MVISTLDGHITYFLWGQPHIIRLPEELPEFVYKQERIFISTCAKLGLESLIHDNQVWDHLVNKKRWIDLEQIGTALTKLREDQIDTYKVLELDWDNTEHIQFGARVFLRQKVDTQEWKDMLDAQRRGSKVHDGHETLTITCRCIPGNLLKSKEFYGWPAVGNGLGVLLAYLNGEYSNKAFLGELPLEEEIIDDKTMFYKFVDWLEATFDPDNNLPKMQQYKALEPFLKKICAFPPEQLFRDALETAAGFPLKYSDITGLKEHRGPVSVAVVREWQRIVAKSTKKVDLANNDLFTALNLDEDTPLDAWLKAGLAQTAGMAIMDSLGKSWKGRFLTGCMYSKGKPLSYLVFFEHNNEGTIICLFNPQDSKTTDSLAKSCLEASVKEYSSLVGRQSEKFTLLNHTSLGVCDQTNIRSDAEVLAMMSLFYSTQCPTRPPPFLSDLGMDLDGLRRDVAMCVQSCTTENMVGVSYDKDSKMEVSGKAVRNVLMSPEKKNVKEVMERSFRESKATD